MTLLQIDLKNTFTKPHAYKTFIKYGYLVNELKPF